MPSSLSSMLAHAREMANASDYKACIDITTEALQSDAALGDEKTANQLLLLRASTYIRLGDNLQAVRDCEQVLQGDPTSVNAYSRHAEALNSLGKSEEALDSIMTAMECDPQNSEIQEAFSFMFNNVAQQRARSEREVSRHNSEGIPTRAISRARLPDVLSTTTRATRLSSKSTTPTDQSPSGRSSTEDSDC